MRALALPLLMAPLVAAADIGPLSVEGGLTGVYLNETDSGAHDESLSGDVIATLPWNDGVWTLYIESSTETSTDSIFNRYPEINADAGTAQDFEGNTRIQVSELNYRFNVGNAHQLTIGQIDPSAHLDRGRLANDENADFLGAGFVNNPSIEFPDYTLGVMYRVPRNERRPEFTAIVSSSDGLADNPGRSYRELIDIGEDGKGVFVGLGARWAFGAARLGLGGWYRSDDHPLLIDENRQGRNYGVFGVYGWQDGAHGYHLRVGAANRDVSPVSGFVSAAYVGETRFGAFGLGAGRILRSSHLERATTAHTTHFEGFWRIPLPLPAAESHLSLSVQHLSNSGFDSTGLLIDDAALFAGLRVHAWFGGG